MTRSGSGCHAILLLLLYAVFVSPIHAQDRTLKGRVVDPRGQGIGGATVFVTPLAGSPAIVHGDLPLRQDGGAREAEGRVVRSSVDGTFSVAVPLGRYRVAAFRSGYGVTLTQVNLQARTQVELRLRPVDGAAGEAAEGIEDLDWILRRTDGDVLRQTGIGLDVPAVAAAWAPLRAPVAGTTSRARPRATLDGGEIVQDFSGSDLLAGETGGPGDASGRSSTLHLHGAAGGRGTWRFDGVDARTTAALGAAAQASGGHATTGLAAEFDGPVGNADRLRADVAYAARRYLFEPGGAMPEVDQERRTTTAGMRWDRVLPGGAQFYLTGAFAEAALLQPAPDPLGAAPAGDGLMADARQADRALGALAGMAIRSPDHALGFGLRVHSYDYELDDDGAILAGAAGGLYPTVPDGRGQTVSLFGEDDWHVAGRYSMQYGMDYHNDFGSGNAYAVPRVGLTTLVPEAGDLRLRSVVLYRTQDPAAAGGPDEPGRGSRIGYELGVERRPEDRLQFAASLSYRPFQEVAGPTGGPPAAGLQEEDALVWGDAAAQRHQMEFELQRGFGSVRGMFLGSVGRVQGRLTAAPGDAPVLVMQSGEARYYSTGLRATIRPTETEVRVDYRRVVGETGSDTAGAPSSLVYRRLDLAVLQDLPFAMFPTSRWRVLMAYEGLLLDSIEGSSSLYGWGATSRVSGGVEITF